MSCKYSNEQVYATVQMKQAIECGVYLACSSLLMTMLIKVQVSRSSALSDLIWSGQNDVRFMGKCPKRGCSGLVYEFWRGLWLSPARSDKISPWHSMARLQVVQWLQVAEQLGNRAGQRGSEERERWEREVAGHCRGANCKEGLSLKVFCPASQHSNVSFHCLHQMHGCI